MLRPHGCRRSSGRLNPVVRAHGGSACRGQRGASIVANYVGSEACVGCHQAAAHDFNATMMGNILIKHPRDDIEKRGCESCHGPGSLYVPEMAKAMGEGKKPEEAMRGPPAEPSLTTFRPDSGESAKQDNAASLICHERGDQAFWRAGTHAFRGVKCVDCHEIMRPTSDFQLAAQFEPIPSSIPVPRPRSASDVIWTRQTR